MKPTECSELSNVVSTSMEFWIVLNLRPPSDTVDEHTLKIYQLRQSCHAIILVVEKGSIPSGYLITT